jgi:HD superfamily phosphohydrolase
MSSIFLISPFCTIFLRMTLEQKRKPNESHVESGDEALAKDLIKQLLRPHKTIRDSVHKDIYVTHLETLILDTLDFQRLRRLKQLGLTNLIYPSANHTRLEHSLGTLYMSELMIEKINKNPFSEFRIGRVDRFIIRLCALLHDLANIPYGHTLEDEGGLFGPQWSEERIERFLGDKSTIGKVILNFETLNALTMLKHNRLTPRKVLEEVRETLRCIELKKPQELTRPYIADIVGNTLCADLLDYTKRDPYFTGISGSYDDRVLSYLYITRFNGKYRLVLRLIKPSTEEIRRDVLSELMDLLRLRYSLAEKVYYHRTKIIASAMLISAVNSMVQEGKLSEKSLFDMDDSVLLNYLNVNGTQIAKHLVNHLLERKLYKIAYDLSYSGEGIAQTERKKKDEIIANLTVPESRYEAERTLEMMSSSSTVVQKNPGSIVIYCPSKKMGVKEIETLVDDGKRIAQLKEVKDPRIEGEIETSITAKHEELWKMYVIVDPEISDIERSYVNGDCQQLFGLPSASEKYRAASHTHYVDRYVDRWHLENPKSPQILATEVKAIKAKLPTRGDSPDKILSYPQFCGQIADIRAPKKA